MRSQKSYMILIVFLIIFALIMYLLVARKNIQEEKKVSTIIVGNTSVWNYYNKKWVNVKKQSTKEKINWETFKVYEDNKYLGDYSVWNDSTKWYYFDKKNNSITPNGKVLAYSSNFDITIDDYNEKQIEDSDKKYINYVLEENNLSTSSKFTSSYKVEIDYDSDSQMEEFYIISNAFPTEFEPDQIFSLAFMVKGNTIYYLYRDIDENKVNNGCKPYYNYFLDFNKDGVDEVILSCGRFSDNGTVDMLYKQENNEFKIQISNQ